MSRHDEYRQNAANPGAIAEAERQRQLRIEQDRNDLIVALRSPEMRRVLWRVIDEGAVFTETFHGVQALDGFDAGKRALARFVMALIDEIDDRAVMEMRAAARDRARRELLALQAAEERAQP